MVTLNLIAANVYGSVDAPIDRGFSYIEIWMVGIQFTILLALFEYAVILAMNRNANETNHGIVQDFSDEDTRRSQIEKNETNIKLMDTYTEIGSVIFFLVFNICYWTIALQ